MLKTITKPPEAEVKEQGRLREHYITLEGKVILSIDEYDKYYCVSWDTNLSGSEGHKQVIEMFEALGVQHSNPAVYVIFQESGRVIPLRKFKDEYQTPPYFDDSRFLLFGLEMEGDLEGTLISYHRIGGRQFGLISRHNMSDLIAHYVLKHLPSPISLSKEGLKKELDSILTAYKPL